MNLKSKIFVAQDDDLIGAGILKCLKSKGYTNVITSREVDLTDEMSVNLLFENEKPEYVFCFAGPHGGIIRNVTYPADLIYTNLKIQCAIINSAYKHNVKKLLFMTGNCAYPKECNQPIIEDYFMAGKMEPTSVAYSTARAAGIEMCFAYNRQYNTNFIPAILTNYYGEGDDYSENGHVLASVMNKIYNANVESAEKLELWGTGAPKRQFMFMDDMAEAIVLVLNKYESKELINIAGGYEFSIKEVSMRLKELIGYKGEIVFNSDKPDGTMRKYLDNSKLLKLGFKESHSFEQGLDLLYKDYLKYRENTDK